MFETVIKTILTMITSAVIGGAITYVAGVVKLRKRIGDLEKWRCFIQQDNDNGIEERRLLLSSVLACLKGLHEQGCNGPVTDGIKILEAYINNQAHQPKSYTLNNQKGGKT